MQQTKTNNARRPWSHGIIDSTILTCITLVQQSISQFCFNDGLLIYWFPTNPHLFDWHMPPWLLGHVADWGMACDFPLNPIPDFHSLQSPLKVHGVSSQNWFLQLLGFPLVWLPRPRPVAWAGNKWNQFIPLEQGGFDDI